MDMNLYCGNHTTPVWTIGRIYTLGNMLGGQVARNGLTDDEALRIVTDELSDPATVAGHAYHTLKQMNEAGFANTTAWVGFVRCVLRYYVPREFDPRTFDYECWKNISDHYDQMFNLTTIISTGPVSKIVVSANPRSVVYNAIEFGATDSPIATSALFLSDQFVGMHGEVLSTDWTHFLYSVTGFRDQ